MNPSPKRIASLDGLRGLAALMVLVFHCTSDFQSSLLQPINPLRSVLWCGVDLFFVLSGFLITGILLRTRESPDYFRVFYARRSLRILPLYYGFVVVVLLLPWILSGISSVGRTVLESAEYQRIWQNRYWLLTHTHNFPQSQQAGAIPGMGHLWSLAVEEQFYFIWPLVIAMVDRRWLKPIIVIGIISQPVLRVYATHAGWDSWSIMHLTYFRMDGLLLGALAATMVEAPHPRSYVTRQRCSLGAGTVGTATLFVLVLTTGTLHWNHASSQPLLYFAVSLIGFSLLTHLVPVESRSGVAAGLFESRFLNAWGKYSYAIYIFHWPLAIAVKSTLRRRVQSLDPIQSDLLDIAVTGIVGLASFVAAWLSWHVFERFWLRFKPHYAPMKSRNRFIESLNQRPG